MAAGEVRKTYMERLPVKRDGRMVFVRVDEVDWMEAQRNYVCIHRGKDSYTIRSTMNYLESELDPRKFIRIHRSTIVNIDRVKAMRPSVRGYGIVELLGGPSLSLSRGYRRKAGVMIPGGSLPGMGVHATLRFSSV